MKFFVLLLVVTTVAGFLPPSGQSPQATDGMVHAMGSIPSTSGQIQPTAVQASTGRQVAAPGACTSSAHANNWWWTRPVGQMGFKKQCIYKVDINGNTERGTKISGCRLDNGKELAIGETGTDDNFCPLKCQSTARPFPETGTRVNLEPAGDCIAPEGQGVCNFRIGFGDNPSQMTDVQLKEGETKEVAAGSWYTCVRQLDGSVSYKKVDAPLGKGVCQFYVDIGAGMQAVSIAEGKTENVFNSGNFYTCERQVDGSVVYKRAEAPAGAGVCRTIIDETVKTVKEGEQEEFAGYGLYKCVRTADGTLSLQRIVRCVSEDYGYNHGLGEKVTHEGQVYECTVGESGNTIYKAV